VTRQANGTYRHKGYAILPVSYESERRWYKWYIQRYHSTGVPLAEELCPHVWSLRGAAAFIDYEIREETE